jgi:biotin carboxyl carrier protein
MNPIPFKATVNDTWSFELDPDGAQALDLVQTAPGSYHLLSDHQPFRIEVIRAEPDRKRFAIRVNGRAYEVGLADDLDQLIERMGFQALSTQNVTRIEAPMPGLILAVHVTEGVQVREGDPLLILEAMKMENVILSPRDGVIRKVAVQKGAAVDKKSLLVEFET